jgi:GR25 family glycosyltransferase involved in LPS biosynthesis
MRIQCFLYGIPFNRHKAIDGKSFHFSDGFIRKYFSNEIRVPQYYNKNSDKSKRIMACAASHFTIWQDSYKKNIPYVFILEDDLILTPQLRQNVNDVIDGLNQYDPGWHIVWLSGWPFRKLKTDGLQKAFAISGHTVYYLNDNGAGCGAYILSRRGLEHYVNILESSGCNDASDGFLWRHIDNRHAYYVNKPICYFTGAIDSTIIK